MLNNFVVWKKTNIKILHQFFHFLIHLIDMKKKRTTYSCTKYSNNIEKNKTTTVNASLLRKFYKNPTINSKEIKQIFIGWSKWPEFSHHHKDSSVLLSATSNFSPKSNTIIHIFHSACPIPFFNPCLAVTCPEWFNVCQVGEWCSVFDWDGYRGSAMAFGGMP